MQPPGQFSQQFSGQTQPQRPYAAGLTAVDNLKFLLEREGIPEQLKNELFLWCSKNLALSNVTISIINETIMPAFDSVVQIIYMELGRNINYRIIRWLEELRAAVILELLRATGGPERERKIVSSGYFETKTEYREQLGKQKGRLGGGQR